MKREFVKLSILAVLGGMLYMGVELLWRGRTHWTMGIVGGVCFVLIGGLNNYLPWEMPIWKQAFCGSALVTAVELVAGVILNLYLGLGIWDYSDLPCNLLGQICLPFSLLWVALSVLCGGGCSTRRSRGIGGKEISKWERIYSWAWAAKPGTSRPCMSA